MHSCSNLPPLKLGEYTRWPPTRFSGYAEWFNINTLNMDIERKFHQPSREEFNKLFVRGENKPTIKQGVSARNSKWQKLNLIYTKRKESFLWYYLQYKIRRIYKKIFLPLGNLVCNSTAVPNSNVTYISNETCVNWNYYYTECKGQGNNPFQGTISFDNIGLAWVAIFLVSVFVYLSYIQKRIVYSCMYICICVLVCRYVVCTRMYTRRGTFIPFQ